MKRQFSEMNGTRDPRYRRNDDKPKIQGTSEMKLLNIERFNGNFPNFQMPKAVGSFSLDIHRNYKNDFSELRYLVLPKDSTERGIYDVEFDLTRGVRDVVEKNEESIRQKMLDDLLTWILQERREENRSIVDPEKPLKPLQIKFVCFRGLITILITTPYESQDSWKIVATKFQDTIYLWQLKEQRRKTGNARQQQIPIWGFKFEQYLCADSPESIPNPNEALNTNAEFCCILKTRLAGHSLLYGAEVDAVKKGFAPPFTDLQNFVELKTNRYIENEHQEASFKRFKSIKWWAQSFIVGIPQIIAGYRDDRGLVSELKMIDVNQLRKDSQNYWKSNICMNFCQKFLEFVWSNVQMSNPNTHFIFEFNAVRRVVSFREEEDGELNRNLLPLWYVEAMQKPV